MNSMHNNGNDKDPAQNDLDKLAGSYSRLQPDEPPELIDLAVLNSAHRAVAKKPGWTQFGWLHGLTTAAIVVLTLSIITLQQPSVAPDGIEFHADEAVNLDQISTAREEASKEPMSARAYDSGVAVQDQKNRKDADRQTPTVSASPDQPQVSEKRGFEESAFFNEVMVESPEPAEKTEADRSLAMKGRSAPKNTLTRTEAQKHLEEILTLKHAGNDAWKTELQKFIRAYPDYPLPDELTDMDRTP